MLYLITLLPALAFLAVLIWLDSFSLVKKGLLFSSFCWGGVAALLSLYANQWLSDLMPVQILIAPIAEEFIKALGIVFIIKQRRSAFFIDAAIYGVAIGTGFSFAENIMYIQHFPNMLPGTAVVRGFGTAFMHCGAVASTAVILSWFTYKQESTIRFLIPALVPAFLLHLLYNSLLLPPVIALMIILFGVTSWLIVLFIYNERSIGEWLELELASEVAMLAAMRKGMFSNSRAGKYMLSVKDQFTPECFFDMYCYVQLYYELSMACKTNMMLTEAGFDIDKKELAAKVKEFYILKKRIGTAAQITLMPLVKQNRLDAWKLESLA